MNTFILILGIILLVSGVVLVIVDAAKDGDYDSESSQRKVKLSKRLSFIFGAILLLFGASFTIIPTGSTGVRSTFGQIEENTLPNGLVFKLPFIQSVQRVNNKKQDVLVAKNPVEGASLEKVKVYVENVVVTYMIQPDKSSFLIRTFSGYDDGSALLSSVTDSAIKSAVVAISAEDVSNRQVVEPEMKRAFQDAVNEKYGEGVITIEAIAVGNTDRDQSYNDAISARNSAEIQRQQQETENQKKIEAAEADANQKRITAQADADQKKITAQAEADARVIEAKSIAEANALIEKSLTSGVLTSKMIDKWDGKYPVVTGQNGAMMIDMNSLIDSIKN